MYRNVVVPWGLKNWGYLAIMVVSLLLLAGCGTDEGNTTVSPNEEEASTLTPHQFGAPRSYRQADPRLHSTSRAVDYRSHNPKNPGSPA